MRIKRLVQRSLLVGALAGSAVAVPAAAAQAYTCKWQSVATWGAGTGASANVYAKDCSTGHYVKGKIYDTKADGRNAVLTIGYNDWGTWDGKGDTAEYSYKAKTSQKSIKIYVKACKYDAAWGPLCGTKKSWTVYFD